MTGVLAFTVPHGDYRAGSWPAVVRCVVLGCPWRRTATDAPETWTCPEHADPFADETVRAVVAAALADQEHRRLTDPPRRESAA